MSLQSLLVLCFILGASSSCAKGRSLKKDFPGWCCENGIIYDSAGAVAEASGNYGGGPWIWLGGNRCQAGASAQATADSGFGDDASADAEAQATSDSGFGNGASAEADAQAFSGGRKLQEFRRPVLFNGNIAGASPDDDDAAAATATPPPPPGGDESSSGRKLLQLFSHRAGPDGKIEGFGHPDDDDAAAATPPPPPGGDESSSGRKLLQLFFRRHIDAPATPPPPPGGK